MANIAATSAALVVTALVQLGTASAAPVAAVAEHQADRLVLPAPKAGRTRPLVAIVAQAAGAETTDFAIPYGVIKSSGAAQVVSLSTRSGPVRLMPALTVLPDQTVEQFDAAVPAGADVVIVPAQMSPKDPVLAAWVKAQAAKGAVIVSICEGARVLANAGLLEGRRATTHWFALQSLEKAYPNTAWVRDRRYVQDGDVISTTGVTASLPTSLALVEAMAGKVVADATARRYGLQDWTAAHRTAAFGVRRSDVLTLLGSSAAFWSHETLEVPLADGVDEVGLALRADAWSRSYRAKVVTTARGRLPVRSQNGLMVLPDEQPKPGRASVSAEESPPTRQLDTAIHQIGRRYGPGSARLVKLALEYGEPEARP